MTFFSATRILYSSSIPYQEKNIEVLCKNGMAIKEEFIIYYEDLLRELEKEKSDFLLFDVREPEEIESYSQTPKIINIKGTIFHCVYKFWKVYCSFLKPHSNDVV